MIVTKSLSLSIPLFYAIFAFSVFQSPHIVDAANALPDLTFWNNDWPSDLISVSEFNRNKNTQEKKILDFLQLENPFLISGQSNLDTIRKSNDPNGQILAGLFTSGKDEIEAKTWNGAWIDEVILPDAASVPHLSEFQLSCGSSWSVKVKYNNSQQLKTITNGNFMVFAAVHGTWITSDEYTPTLHPTASPTPVSENSSPPVLNGTALFAQFQVIPSKHGVQGDHQPHLISHRKTLVMLDPHNMDDTDIEEITVSVLDENETVISSVIMDDPSNITKQEGFINLGGVNVDDIIFPSSLANAYTVQGQSNLDPIKDDQDAMVLTNLLNSQSSNVTVRTQDGSWIKNIYLPDGKNVPSNSKVQLTCDSGWKVNLFYPNEDLDGIWRTKRASRGDVIVVILVNGVWIHEDDIEHNKYIFAHNFYSATLEKELVEPGMILQFTATPMDPLDEDKVGILSEIEVGGVTELMLTTIDVGMLTQPRNEFDFRDDVKAHKEYFETAPLSRLIVVQYETMHFTEIMLPSGKLYDSVSDDNGGWHTGDMRQHIGKILISHGIDLANYGMHSSKGDSESSHPFTCALLTAHNTVGMYQNGRQVHGGSGGNGMVTLDNSLGNEFSHEVGHNYGLGHFVGGFDGSVHRPAEEINSSWGWDSEANVFRPNFDASNSGDEQCLDDACQNAYVGKYRFGTDSMAGGYPMWQGSNRFTMYTPYVAKIIQTFLENKAVWDPSSSTGFRKFDQSTGKMDEYINDHNGGKVPYLYRVPVTTIVGYYDPSPTRGLPDYIYPALHGAYGYVYNDEGEGDGSECQLKVRTNNGDLFYTLTTQVHSSTSMNKFHVNVATSDGAFEALIYCYGVLRTKLTLNGPNPNDRLIYTVTGMPFDNLSEAPTGTPTEAPSEAPTEAPTEAPSESPTATPSVPSTVFPTATPTETPTDNLAVVPTETPTVAPESPISISDDDFVFGVTSDQIEAIAALIGAIFQFLFALFGLN